MKKTLLLLAATLFALTVSITPLLADGQPWNPPGKLVSLR